MRYCDPLNPVPLSYAPNLADILLPSNPTSLDPTIPSFFDSLRITPAGPNENPPSYRITLIEVKGPMTGPITPRAFFTLQGNVTPNDDNLDAWLNWSPCQQGIPSTSCQLLQIPAGTSGSIKYTVVASTDPLPVPSPLSFSVNSNTTGNLAVEGGVLSGNTLEVPCNARINLGSNPNGILDLTAGGGNGLNLSPGSALIFQAGTAGQMVRITDPSGVSQIDGTLEVETTSGNAPSLELRGRDIHGNGTVVANSASVVLTGTINNPVHNGDFLENYVRFTPTSGIDLQMNLVLHGNTSQVVNFKVDGNLLLTLPSTWPASSGFPQPSLPLLPGQILSQPLINGNGSLLIQATGNITLSDGGTTSKNFVFPGGIVLKAGSTIDLAGLDIVNGWNSAGIPFQGVFFEAPSIESSNGVPNVYTSTNQWVNFSAQPSTKMHFYAIGASGGYVNVDGSAPHLNTYSEILDAAVNPANPSYPCWVCVVNPTPIRVDP